MERHPQALNIPEWAKGSPEQPTPARDGSYYWDQNLTVFFTLVIAFFVVD